MTASDTSHDSHGHSSRVIHRGPYPELTWPAVIVGWFLGAIIAVSIGYAALILGFSIEGSELAAILGWGILRGVLRRTSIVENNINQTIASAVNGASAGMMFSIPALFILAETSSDKNGEFAGVTQFNVPLMVLACITGGVLGLAFIIPLRKQMIDFDRLAYPGGIAVATILKSPGAGLKKALYLLGAGVVSGAFYLTVIWLTGSDHPEWKLGEQLGLPKYLNVTLFLSLMTVGVGFLSGKGGFWFGAGGFICYWLLAPLLSVIGQGGVPDLLSDPGDLRMTLFRPTGIGMLIGAALCGIVAAFPLIRSALRSMHEASRGGGDGKKAFSDEMPIRLLYYGIAGGVVVLIAICYQSVTEMTLWRAALMAVLGTGVGGRRNRVRMPGANKLVAAVGHDLDRGHDSVDHRASGNEQPRSRPEFRHDWRCHLRGHRAGRRHDVGSEVRVPGRSHAETAAVGPIHRFLVGAFDRDRADLRAPQTAHPGKRRPSCSSGRSLGVDDSRHRQRGRANLSLRGRRRAGRGARLQRPGRHWSSDRPGLLHAIWHRIDIHDGESTSSRDRPVSRTPVF